MRIRRSVIIIAQVLVGSLFALSGYLKAIDPAGTAIKIGEYFASIGIRIPEALSLFASVGLCSFEFILGILVFSGSYRRISSKLVFIFMSFMTLLTLYLAVFNPVKDCGCFGDAFHISNWSTFGKNVVLLALSFLLLKYPKLMLRVFSRVGRWVPTIIAVLGIFLFCWLNIRHLPDKDFRPFKMGAELKSLVSIPDDAPHDEYDISFVYEKDGQRETFALDALPDSTWTFVDRNETLIREGARPLVEDFHVFDYEGEELTDIILDEAETTGLVLLLAPSWQTAGESKMDIIGEIYDHVTARGLPFYGLAGSTEEEAEDWRYRTGADYPLLLLDGTTIKTMIRANPGLIFLRDGKITAKVAQADFPSINEVGNFLDKTLGTDSLAPRYKKPLPWRSLPVVLVLAIIVVGYVVQFFRHRHVALKRRNSLQRAKK